MRILKLWSLVVGVKILPLLSIIIAGISGCVFETKEQVAGGAQDFPNTVALGKAASSHISENGDWDQFSAIPATLPDPQSADSIAVPAESLFATPKVSAALLKQGAVSDSSYLDYSDTATLKIIRRIHFQETLIKIKFDTVTFRYDGTIVDSIKGNELVLESKGAELWKLSQRLSAYRYENTDSAGGLDRATFLDRTPTYIPIGYRVKLLILTPGIDGSFLTKSDNVPLYYAYARTRTLDTGSPDTLEFFDISDADGDRALWGSGDSGVVEFRQKIPTPSLRPAVELVVQKMRTMLFKDGQKSYPLSFRETRVEKDGKKIIYSIRGNRNGVDSTFNPGDTVVITQHIEFPAGARMVEKTTKYKVVLSPVLKQYSEAKLIRYSLEAVWGVDSLSATKFTFMPDTPKQSNDLSLTGELQLDYDFANGRKGMALGRYEDKIITANLIDTDRIGRERRFKLKWNSVGDVLTEEAVD